jgi:hypothetical protein
MTGERVALRAGRILRRRSWIASAMTSMPSGDRSSEARESAIATFRARHDVPVRVR